MLMLVEASAVGAAAATALAATTFGAGRFAAAVTATGTGIGACALWAAAGRDAVKPVVAGWAVGAVGGVRAGGDMLSSMLLFSEMRRARRRAVASVAFTARLAEAGEGRLGSAMETAGGAADDMCDGPEPEGVACEIACWLDPFATGKPRGAGAGGAPWER